MARIFCLLPAARVHLASVVTASGGVPVIDLTSGEAVAVPAGAWVRVASSAGVVPGEAGVFTLAGPPVSGRETWIEGPSTGHAGVVVRGSGSGGRFGAIDARDVESADAMILDWPHGPTDLPSCDLLLSDVLFALLDPPEALRERLARLEPSDLRQVEGIALVASVAAPAVRRLAAGESAEGVAAGLWEQGDAFAHAWLGGRGLLVTAALAEQHGTLGGLVSAFVRAQPRTARSPAPMGSFGAPVAIVGIGCRLPGANSATQLWERLIAGYSGIVEVPANRWDPTLYWSEDHGAPDKTYSKIGGFLTDFRFNPRRFRIPPSTVPLIDPVQQIALEASADALEDAGYGPDRAFDRERVAVILGQSMGGEITDQYAVRVFLPMLERALSAVPAFTALPAELQAEILAAFERQVKSTLPIINEDSMPGELANVVAGRVTNALNLGGPNFTTDAACAGSMAAIQAAVKGLQDGDFDMALTGGSDRSMGPPTYVKFSKIGALSADGSRPFAEGANGFVMGEGCGVLVLKRLDDAERDGDRIYAVIRGIGASSDGKGKGITAPNPEGQRRALKRAYENAGVDPGTVDLFECHGTSTHVGDKVEVEALGELVAGRRSSPARIGSIKSNIGHLKAAAGSAATIKAALAVFHRTLPPSINCVTPRSDVDFARGPLQVQTLAEPWTSDVRRVGVSAFGFGGTNFHLVLEGYTPGQPRVAPPPAPPSPSPSSLPRTAPGVSIAPYFAIPAPTPEISADRGIPVPAGIWALSADTPEELIARCRALKRGQPQAYEPNAPLRVAAAAESEEERAQQLDKVIQTVQKGKGYDLLRQRGIHLEDVPCDGQLAFVFTGQGSQYIDMGLDLAAHFPIVAQTFAEADAVMTPYLGRPLTEIIRRDPRFTEEEQFDRLRQTEISQPATLTVDVAILRLLAGFGVRPDVVAGHSLGEYGAAVAAGMLTFSDALVAVSARGREMAAVKLPDFGKMAGVATNVDTVEAVLAEIPGYVVAANKNCPTQTVIAGESEAVEAAIEAFRSRGVTVHPLPVSHAFHSRIVAPASEPLRRVLSGLDLREPRRRITTNVNSRYYPTGVGARDAAIDILARQVASPVEWIAQVERMYADGARVFVECGPKRALAGFIVNILKHRPHRALYTNQPKRGGVLSFLDALASLFALGFPVDGEVAPGVWADAGLFDTGGPRRSTTTALQGRTQAIAAAQAAGGETHGAPAIERDILKIVAAKTGWPVESLDVNFDLEADLGIDTVKLADIVASVREHFRLEHDPNFRLGDHRTLRALIDYAGRRVGSTRPGGVPARRPAAVAPSGAFDGESGADTVSRFLAEVAQKDLGGLDAPAFAQAMLPAIQALLAASWQAFQTSAPGVPAPTASAPIAFARAAASPAATLAPAQAPSPAAPTASPAPVTPAPAIQAPGTSPGPGYIAPVSIVCSGASLGLPAGASVFADDNIQRMLKGENRIVPLSLATREAMVQKGIRRLVKNPKTGEGEFVLADSPLSVIQLAGVKAHFDLEADYGVDGAVVRTLDITTQLAFAAGLEALRDAGIPLVRSYRETSNGKRVATGWVLPPSMRDDTGIVFASAFPGYDQMVAHFEANGKTTEPDGTQAFDRRFLFQVLAMGHSQFAQFIGARGPNTQVNAACASTTQGIGIGEDWIRLGRCKRVIVIGSDDVTNDRLMPWIGAGFLAAGAATVEPVVEKAALPFDRRRHGMILGMGAVGLVLERTEDVAARGMVGVAELIGTHFTNSAFHGTRLDADHITREVKRFMAEVLERTGETAEAFASRCVFLSHETYTPARGGSAAAEMASLPAAFGPAASKIVIANTKGFTGHPMGAGIEDTVAVKALQYRLVPHIANLKEPDSDLGELCLSTGGSYPIDYALRLAAGFGSQLALAAWKRAAVGDARITDPAAYKRWLSAEGVGGTVVAFRQLRGTGRDDPRSSRPPVAAAAALAAIPALPPPVATPPAPVAAQPAASPRTTAAPIVAASRTPEIAAASSTDAMLKDLLEVVGRRTGYEPAELDPTYELEADLGVDTVKQAEIFGEMRDRHGIARDDGFKLSEYPTIEKLAQYLASRVATVPPPGPNEGGKPIPSVPSGIKTVTPSLPPGIAVLPVEDVPAPPEPPASAVPLAPGETVLDVLLAVVARRTGYDVGELDPTFELEGDLGIDTVKQAEIFGEVRDRFGIGRDDGFKLADYPTIARLAAWMESKATVSRASGAPDVRPTLTHAEPAAVQGSTGRVNTLTPGDADRTPPADPSPPEAGSEPAPAPKEAGAPAVEATRAPMGHSPFDLPLEPEVFEPLEFSDASEPVDFSEVEPQPPKPYIDTVDTPEFSGEEPPPPVTALVPPSDDDDENPFAPPPELAPVIEALPAEEGPDEPTSSSSPGFSVSATSSKFSHSLPSRRIEEIPDLALLGLPAIVMVPQDAATRRDPRNLAALPTRRASAASLPPSPLSALFAETTPFGLPASFRVRRPFRIARVPMGTPAVVGRNVEVLGEGWLAVALRMEVDRRGGVSELPAGVVPDAIIDAGASPLEAFQRARALAATPPKQWLCVLQSSSHSAAQAPTPASALRQVRDQGARAGIAKALGREWAGCEGRVVRLDPALTPELAARAALEELAEVDGALETWRTVDGREVAILDTEAWPQGRGRIPIDPVVILTGGTRGITARVASAIATRGPCTLVLVARSKPGAHALDEGIEKARIREELTAGGRRATPRQIDDALRPLRVAEEARRTVGGLKLAGAKVDVRVTDLADPEAVKKLVADVLATYKRIDICVHGAGVEESRTIADKDDAAFKRVFDGKAEGGLVLATELPATTFFLSMGSVAGRFGNPGQVDYSAANEALAQVCMKRPDSLHVCWTAWGDVGMAVRGGMQTLLTDRGVELLPAGPGARLTVGFLDAGVIGEVLVAGKLGGFPMPALHPLCDTVSWDGDAVVVTRSMSQASEPWMADHAIDGVWVLPGVIGLELMAAAALLACPHGRYMGAEEVKFAAPLKLHREEPVTVEIRATPQGDGIVHCTLQSTRVAKTGRVLTTSHFEAKVHLDEMPLMPTLPSTFLPDEPISSREIYRRFFHGQSFQVLRGVEAVALQGLFAEARVEHATIAEGLLTDPLVLEAAFQAAGLHRMAIHGVMALPSAIDVLERVSPVIEGDTLNVMVQLRKGSDGADLYDIDVDGSSGRVLRVRGFRLIDRGPLPPNERLPVPEGGWASVASASVADASELPHRDIKAMTARGTPKRQADRLAGQVAARRAVAALTTGEFQVQRLPTGAPSVEAEEEVFVSITHREGQAWAVASHRPVGVDVEQIVARSEAFAADWFRPEEALLTDEDQTIGWAIKEAVLKHLGVGMAESPRDVVVTRGEGWEARLVGALAGRFGDRGFAASVRRTGDLIGVVVVRAGELKRRVA